MSSLYRHALPSSFAGRVDSVASASVEEPFDSTLAADNSFASADASDDVVA